MTGVVHSSAWTGIIPAAPWPRAHGSFWAKLFVWVRDEAKIRLCKARGGHVLSWRGDFCEICGMAAERIEDHPRTLRQGLNKRLWVIL